MATTEKILYDYGITSDQLVKLYRYDLLDILSTIPGIGCGRIEELKQDLGETHSTTRLPQAYTWVYPLTIEILKISTDRSFYCANGDQPATLNALKKVDKHIFGEFSDWFSQALSLREQNILRGLYRDHKTPHNLAHELGVSYQYPTKLKGAAVRKLRAPRNIQMLRKIMFIGDAAVYPGIF